MKKTFSKAISMAAIVCILATTLIGAPFVSAQAAIDEPVRSSTNADLTDNITGINTLFGDITGSFDGSTDTYTITACNGANQFAGLSVNTEYEYAIKMGITVPSAGQAVRVIVNGDSSQRHLGVYMYDSSLVVYDLEGGVEQHNLGSGSYTRAVGTKSNVTFLISKNVLSIWVDASLCIDGITVPTYNGTFIGTYANGYGYPIAVGSVVISDLDIFYTTEYNEAVPAKVSGNTDYAQYITSYSNDLWGVDADNYLVKNTGNVGFSYSYFNGAFFAEGVSFNTSKEYVIKTDITVPKAGGRTDLIFKGNNVNNYFAVYIYDNAVVLYKYNSYVDNYIATSRIKNNRTAGTAQTVTIAVKSGSFSLWIGNTQFFNDYAIADTGYSGNFGLNCGGYATGSEYISVSNVSIFYSETENPAPVKPTNNKDMADNITGIWTLFGDNTGNFDGSTDTYSITKCNGANKYTGLSVDTSKEYAIKMGITVPSSGHDVRVIINGDTYQRHLGVYMYDSSMVVYDLEGGVEQHVLGSGSYTRTVGIKSDVVFLISGNKLSVWVNGGLCIDEITVPTYSGAFIGAYANGYGYPISGGSVVLSGIDIFYTEPEISSIPLGNDNHANSISSFSNDLWGVDADSYVTYTAQSRTMSWSYFNGPFLAEGYSLDEGDYIVKTDVVAASAGGRIDIIFQAKGVTDYFALYTWDSSVQLYQYTYPSDIHIASSDISYTRTAGNSDEFAFGMSNGKVSVWINGICYFYEQEISNSGYSPVIGASAGGVGTATFSDLQLYSLTDENPMPSRISENQNLIGTATLSSDLNSVETTYAEYSSSNQTVSYSYFNGSFYIDNLSVYSELETIYSVNTTALTQGGRIDVMFKKKIFSNYLSVYITDTSVQIYKYDYNDGGDVLIATSSVPYSRKAGIADNVVVTTKPGKVSVWINGVKYFNNCPIEDRGYETCVGFNSYGTGTVTYANMDLSYLVPDSYANTLINAVVTSTTYKVSDKYILSVAPGTIVDDFISGLTALNCTFEVYYGDTAITSGVVKTGMTVKTIALDTVAHTYEIAVRGDVNGTGYVDILDLLLAKDYVLSESGLEGVYLKAVDIYSTGSKPSTLDIIRIKNALIGKQDLSEATYTSSYSEDAFKVSAYLSYYHTASDTTGLNNTIGLLKNANIDVLFPCQFPTDTELFTTLDACEASGMDFIAENPRAISGINGSINETAISTLVSNLINYNHLYGYYTYDEPTVSSFANLDTVNQLIKKYDNSALTYTCTLPSYSAYTWTNAVAESYNEYVDKYIAATNPQILSSNYYLFGTANSPDLSTSNLWKDLGYWRKKSIETSIPYWHTFQAITDYDYATYENIDIDKLKMQINSALAYGAKGVTYFTATNTIVSDEGIASGLYNDIAQLNTEAHGIGNLLYNCTATEIYQPGVSNSYETAFNLDAVANSNLISSMSGSDVIVSVFENNGTNYIVVSNKSYNSAVSGSITLKSSKGVSEYYAATLGNSDEVQTSTISYNLSSGGIQVFIVK